MFVPRQASNRPGDTGWLADTLHIYDQRDIAALEISERAVSHRLPSIGDRGIRASEPHTRTTPATAEPPRSPPSPSHEDEPQSITVPTWLFAVYGGLFVVGGLLWMWGDH
ncbi:MAG: hypothetical protein ABEI77_09785 [Halorientalis sp.]